MTTKETANQGENFTLHDLLKMGQNRSLKQRTKFFYRYRQKLMAQHEDFYLRTVTAAADREIEILDPYSGKRKKMLMFGSNNYLGFANDPFIRAEVRKAMEKFGAGIGGPPLLNGYTRLHRELEERLSALKHAEDTLIFPTGYSANVGLLTGLMSAGDCVIFDEISHASFRDGLRMAGTDSVTFPHNNMEGLENHLRQRATVSSGETFVGVEVAYSMDGDLAPLDTISDLCRYYHARLIVDDAHGTGVMGAGGSGTAEHFGVSGKIDIHMGTFSKTFAVTGGFISAGKELVHYLRFFARSYMFSASLPPTVVAAVLAGIKLMKKEPWRQKRLHENVVYAAAGLRRLGFPVRPHAAIIALRVPPAMNIRQAAHLFHTKGIFVNSVEYPAVAADQQRFRISIMASHTKDDIDRLLEVVDGVWKKFGRTSKSAPFNNSGKVKALVFD